MDQVFLPENQELPESLLKELSSLPSKMWKSLNEELPWFPLIPFLFVAVVLTQSCCCGASDIELAQTVGIHNRADGERSNVHHPELLSSSLMQELGITSGCFCWEWWEGVLCLGGRICIDTWLGKEILENASFFQYLFFSFFSNRISKIYPMHGYLAQDLIF